VCDTEVEELAGINSQSQAISCWNRSQIHPVPWTPPAILGCGDGLWRHAGLLQSSDWQIPSQATRAFWTKRCYCTKRSTGTLVNSIWTLQSLFPSTSNWSSGVTDYNDVIGPAYNMNGLGARTCGSGH